MKIQNISKLKGSRQDGAISAGYLFSFNSLGVCTVYEMASVKCMEGGEAEVFSEFTLDKNDFIRPHSNSVAFGNEYYDENDEFPLLYTNIYNNYANSDDKLKGVCLVYRLQRFDKDFVTTLVHIIEVGFVENDKLWKSSAEKEDVRPYGNFVIDTDNSIFYAFTMRDNLHSTRFFAFKLPKVNQGEFCEEYNVKKITLRESDILEWFDCEYQHYMQGACCHNNKIYSLEGFTDSLDNPSAIRIIDTKLKKQIYFKEFKELGTNVEPEMIDFENDICYYADHNGNAYELFFTDI